MKNANITFIGCGNMGRSLIGGLIADGIDPGAIRGADPDPARRDSLSETYGIEVGGDNLAAVSGADVVILAVKPQMLLRVLAGVAPALKQRRPLVISIAAGLRISSLEKILGAGHPVVRVMPNTPALIQAGASALYANTAVSGDQRDLAEGIMRAVGLALWLDDESAMDAVTALSGSGPAYFFLVMEALEQAAVELGLPPGQARLLTLETAFGAAKMALESESGAATLRQQVTSPGGTTERALKVLMEEGDLMSVFSKALTAARDRSIELAQTLEQP